MWFDGDGHMELWPVFMTAKHELIEWLVATDSIKFDSENFKCFLTQVIMEERTDILETLLQRGLDPNELRGESDISLLSLAKIYNKLDIEKKLIEYEAKIHVSDIYRIANSTIEIGTAEYHKFLDYFYENVSLDQLFDFPYEHTPFHSEFSPSALHFAAMYDQPKYVEVLLKRGANVDICNDEMPYTPLEFVINISCRSRFYRNTNLREKSKNLKEIVDILLENGADVNEVDLQMYNIIGFIAEMAEEIDEELMQINFNVTRHIARLRFFKIQKIGEFIIQSIEFEPQLDQYYNKCIKELEDMKDKTFEVEDVEIKLSDMFDERSIGFSRYIRCRVRCDANSSNQIDVQVIVTEYPIYGEVLLKKFKLADYRCNLLIQAASGLSKLFHRTLRVDHLIVGNIFQYLREGDFKTLSMI